MISCLIPVFLAVIYVIYPFGGGRLTPVRLRRWRVANLGLPTGATAGDGRSGCITYYLAFDLVVGKIVLRNAQEKQVLYWLIIVPLFFCFMLGRAGFLLFWIILSARCTPGDW